MSETAQEGAIDWDEVQYEYRLVAGVLDDLKCTTNDDLERYRLSVAPGSKAKSPLLQQIHRGYLTYDERHSSLLEEILSKWNSIENCEAPAWRNAKSRAVIEESIRSRKLLPGFIEAWGWMHTLYGRLSVLMEVTESVDAGRASSGDQRNFTTEQLMNIARGNRKGRRLQKYWYALWVKANATSLRPGDRERTSSDLALLCQHIKYGLVEPFSGFDRGWFGQMVKPNKNNKRFERILLTTRRNSSMRT